jgi:Arc/MetJ-type ribon-helix-helix transcriptional regulator
MREIKKLPFSSIEKTNPLFVGELDTFGASKVNGYKITVRLSTMLIDILRNIITSNKTGGNFEYTNVSDLLRKSLEAYKNGMSLIVQRTKDEKKETSFRVSKELKEFYLSLPENAKSEIIERAAYTYIKHKI